MKSFSTLSVLAFGMMAAIFSNTALAAKSANANVSNFGFTLIDLDTSDDITPALSFYNVVGSSNNSFIFDRGSDYFSGAANRSVRQWKNYQTSLLIDDELGKTSAGVLGDSFFAQGDLVNSSNANFNAEQHLSAGFTLTPHTKLVMFGTLFGSAINPGNGDYWYNYAKSGSEVSLGDQYDDNRSFASGQATTQSGDNEQYYESDFSMSYVNRGSNSIYGALSVHTFATARDYGNLANGSIPAVPEPETYAMLLSGLALMGVLARRRASKQIV